MENFLFHHDHYMSEYNCSFINISQVPLEKRQHPFIGGSILTLGIIFECLYIPVLISIHKHSQYPCYNLMRFMGFFDIMVIPIIGIFTGLGFIFGWVYCTAPRLIYILGATSTSLWLCVAFLSMILAFNRCVEMFSSDWGKRLFYGKRIYIWQIFPPLYGLYYFWFERPILLTSVFCAWFFNPYPGYHDDFEHYFSNLLYFNNMVIVFGLPTLYIIFFIALTIRRKVLVRNTGNTTDSNNHAKKQYGTFIQVLVISVFNITGCLDYIYLQFFSAGVSVVVIASYSWLLVHGLPPVILLCLNETIRRDCKKMLRLGRGSVEATYSMSHAERVGSKIPSSRMSITH